MEDPNQEIDHTKKLSEDPLLYIFSFLAPKDIIHAKQVDKLWKRVIEENIDKLEARFPLIKKWKDLKSKKKISPVTEIYILSMLNYLYYSKEELKDNEKKIIEEYLDQVITFGLNTENTSEKTGQKVKAIIIKQLADYTILFKLQEELNKVADKDKIGVFKQFRETSFFQRTKQIIERINNRSLTPPQLSALTTAVLSMVSNSYIEKIAEQYMGEDGNKGIDLTYRGKRYYARYKALIQKLTTSDEYPNDNLIYKDLRVAIMYFGIAFLYKAPTALEDNSFKQSITIIIEENKLDMNKLITESMEGIKNLLMSDLQDENDYKIEIDTLQTMLNQLKPEYKSDHQLCT